MLKKLLLSLLLLSGCCSDRSAKAPQLTDEQMINNAGLPFEGPQQ